MLDEAARPVATPRLYPPSVTPPDRPLPLLQFLATFVRNPLRSLPAPVYDQPIVAVQQAGRTTIWVCAPNLIEQVLLTETDSFGKSPIERRVFDLSLGDGVLTSEGQLWRWQRRVMAPLFRPSEIERYVPSMVAAADEVVADWRRTGRRGIRRIDADMTNATFSVITRTMLAGGAPAESDIIKRATHDYLDRVSWEVAYGLLRIPMWVWNPAKSQMRRAAADLRSAVAAIVARRERAGDTEIGDLLGRLLAARDPETGEPMPRDRLINNLLTLLEAGHETTAKALTWTLYLLARAPDWQDRVRAEIMRVVGDTPVAAAHVAKLTVTQQVLKEAMRLYPPVPVMVRQARKPVTIGDHQVAKDGIVVIPIYAIHRHRQLWDDPDAFDPERFAPEREAKIWRTQFMPFGAGPRICLGMAFAMMEATVILATLFRAARFDWDGTHLPEPVSRVTLRPEGGMPLAVTLLH
jgi:cytochrome P450